MSKTNCIWVVEWFVRGKWHPTMSVGLTKDKSLLVLAKWRSVMSNDKFRLIKYTSANPPTP